MYSQTFKINSNIENYTNDLCDVLRAFEPYVTFDATSTSAFDVSFSDTPEGAVIRITSVGCPAAFSVDRSDNVSFSATGSDALARKRLLKHTAKRMLYDILCSAVGVSLPYGSLTGIRPTKLYYELTAAGENADEILRDVYCVSPEKLSLIQSIIAGQRGIYGTDTEAIDLFINIPVCPTRCSYCSFLSIERGKLRRGTMERYVSALSQELSLFASSFDMARVRSVYIGGGTPTVLEPTELRQVMDSLASLHLAQGTEITVEGGRPDTLTEEKISILTDCGVTRLSVNPQTLNDTTLQRIGRRHSVDDFFRVMDMLQGSGLIINNDLIAMLPGETTEDFSRSLNGVISCAPENITVHTLAMKRGSVLSGEGYDNQTALKTAREMIDYSIDTLHANGYAPYYMYRLKHMSGGHENVGYTRPGYACVYNIDIMEETHSIYGIGAGAMSKRMFAGNRLERFVQSKDIYYYLDNFDTLMSQKAEFFTK